MTAPKIGPNLCYSSQQSQNWRRSKHTPWTHIPVKYYTFIQADHHHVLSATSNIVFFLFRTSLSLKFNSSLSAVLSVLSFSTSLSESVSGRVPKLWTGCFILRNTVRRKQKTNRSRQRPTRRPPSCARQSWKATIPSTWTCSQPRYNCKIIIQHLI